MELAIRIEELLAQDDEAIEQVATLRWAEWGTEFGSERVEDWRRVTLAECRPEAQEDIPFTLVARDVEGCVVGAVALVSTDPEGVPDRGPWVVGTVVAPECRGRGIGLALVASVSEQVPDGLLPTWVSTRYASEFYMRCGYNRSAGSQTILYRN